jgi:hypothetical protein
MYGLSHVPLAIHAEGGPMNHDPSRIPALFLGATTRRKAVAGAECCSLLGCFGSTCQLLPI